MRTTVTALVAAATLAGAAVASSSPAQAWHGGWGWGWGLGGFALGAAVGSAFAAPSYFPYPSHPVTMAISHRLPTRRPWRGAVYGTATLGFAPASNRPVAQAKPRKQLRRSLVERLSLAKFSAPNFRQRVAVEFRRVRREFGGFGDFRLLTSQIGTPPITLGKHMHKSLVGLAAAAAVGFATGPPPTPAN